RQCESLPTCLMRRGVNQRPTDAAAPKIRLDEQSVELATDQRREPRDLALKLGHDHLAVGNLRRGQMDRIRVGKQLLAVVCKLQRSAALQLFQLLMLLRPSEPKRHRFSALGHSSPERLRWPSACPCRERVLLSP